MVQPYATVEPIVGSRATIRSLEGLRGVAALMVACYHGWDVTGLDVIAIANSWLWVDLFFVLSGAVMVRSYGERIDSRRAAANYLVRRFGRLYPLHVASLALFVVAALAVPALKTALTGRAYDLDYVTSLLPLSDLPANVLLLQGMATVERLSFNYPSWSISVEFWTYVAFAVVSLLVSPRRRLAAFVGLAIAGALALALASQRDSIQSDHDFGFLRCLFGFFVGAAVATLAQRGRTATATGPVAMLAVLAVLHLAGHVPPLTYAFPVLAGWLVSSVWTDTSRLARAFGAPMLVRLGALSYSVYMLHAPMLLFFKPIGMSVDPTWSALLYLPYLAGLVLLASIAHRRIEVPARDAFQRLAERLIPVGGDASARRARVGESPS